MPERCDSSCSTVTSSPISGRSAPSTERAAVERSSEPSSIRLATATAVKPLLPLAMANCGRAVRDRVAAIGEAVRLRQLDLAVAVDAHDAGEARRSAAIESIEPSNAAIRPARERGGRKPSAPPPSCPHAASMSRRASAAPSPARARGRART